MAFLGAYIQEICIILCSGWEHSFHVFYEVRMKNLSNENDSLKLFRIKNPKLPLSKLFPVKEKERWNSFENS